MSNEHVVPQGLGEALTASQSLPAVSLTGEVLIRHRFEAPAGRDHLSRQPVASAWSGPQDESRVPGLQLGVAKRP